MKRTGRQTRQPPQFRSAKIFVCAICIQQLTSTYSRNRKGVSMSEVKVRRPHHARSQMNRSEIFSEGWSGANKSNLGEGRAISGKQAYMAVREGSASIIQHTTSR